MSQSTWPEVTYLSTNRVIRPRSIHEVDDGRNGDDSPLIAHVEKGPNRMPAIGAIIQRALVHIHTHEAAGHCGIEIAGELHGILERLIAMVEGIANAVPQRLGEDGVIVRGERTPDDISAQGKH